MALNTNMKHSRVLCVDDEPNVLEGLTRVLHRKCLLLTATSGREAMSILAGPAPIDVIVTDMRMPEMNGATLLAECRRCSPDTVRLLLTGHADMQAAISAVNDGQVFRFLTKPCPPLDFIEAIEAAVEKHKLCKSERLLFEQTVLGSVRALTEVIALVHPGAVASTAQQLDRVRKVTAYLRVDEAWHVEVAVILAQAGYVVLANDLLARRVEGSSGKPDAALLSRVPLVLARVLAGVPRLDLAQAALKHRDRLFDATTSDAPAPIAARILKVLCDLDLEEAQGHDTTAALFALRARPGVYDPAVLDAVSLVCAVRDRELPGALSSWQLRGPGVAG